MPESLSTSLLPPESAPETPSESAPIVRQRRKFSTGLWAIVGIVTFLVYVTSPPFAIALLVWVDQHWSMGAYGEAVVEGIYYPLEFWGEYYPETIPAWYTNYNQYVFEGLVHLLGLNDL